MKTILLVGFIAFVNAKIPLLLDELPDDNTYVHLGPYKTEVKIGDISKRYPVLDDKDLTASRNARKFFEQSRVVFRYGLFTLPPLDPYTRDYLPTLVLDDDLKQLKGVVQITNYNATGLVKFVQDLVEVRLKTGRLDYALKVPELDVRMELNGHFVWNERMPIHVVGELSLVLQGISVLGAVQTKPHQVNKQWYLQVVGQHTKLQVGDVALKFRGTRFDIMRNTESDLNATSVGAPPKKYNNLEDHLKNYVAQLVMDQANTILDGPTLDQILDILLPRF